MKKYLPVILFIVGLVVLAGVFFFVKGKRDEPTIEEEEETSLIEVPLNERPVASLYPSEDGHWLKLVIDKIEVDAYSLDYELLYKLPDGRTQGVPGSLELEDQGTIERDLLLGSESSGKFRYDEGVENGTLTLRFRNERGQLLVKFSTEFHLQNSTDELTSVDDNLRVTLDSASDDFFVTMETFGYPESPPKEAAAGPYGVFTSSESTLSGSVELDDLNVFKYVTGQGWGEHEGGEEFASDSNIFIGVSE
ncbi:MAG: hypothetical protein PVJ52_02125 [Candidatus Woesebacteria bacterium]|jgi:hypothetical protein